MVVHRHQMRETLSRLVRLLTKQPKAGTLTTSSTAAPAAAEVAAQAAGAA